MNAPTGGYIFSVAVSYSMQDIHSTDYKAIYSISFWIKTC